MTRFREDAGLTLAQAAEWLYTSRSAVSRLETGGTKVNVHILKSMLDVYNIGGDRWPGLIQMAVRSGEKGWWHEFGPGVAGTYVDFETEVEELLMFGLAIVPGLLQTAEYMRSFAQRGDPGAPIRESSPSSGGCVHHRALSLALAEPDIVYHQYPFNEQFLDRCWQTIGAGVAQEQLWWHH